MNWSLHKLLDGLHRRIESDLKQIRESMGQPTAAGDASEAVWNELFNKHLPKRYRSARAFVVDSRSEFSQQQDVVIYDQQYSPLIFELNGQTVIAAESVYAVFEAKPSASAKQVAYAQDKAESVRKLHRTSLPIPHAGGVYPPKPPPHITTGLLTFESDWVSPPMGEAFQTALAAGVGDRQLDMGCVAAQGYFERTPESGAYLFDTEGKHATGFLFKLIATLQAKATVPMIDIDAYAAWLAE